MAVNEAQVWHTKLTMLSSRVEAAWKPDFGDGLLAEEDPLIQSS